MYTFRDRLQPAARIINAATFVSLEGRDRDMAFFQKGFLPPYFEALFKQISNQPRSREDVFFWQFPCRTEGAAFDLHANVSEAPFTEGALNTYLGFPWATFIDKKSLDEYQLQIARVRLSGFRHALRELGVKLRVHTVCQHIYWRDMIPIWESLGITDVWLSHMPETQGIADEALPFVIHPWHLYAVNVQTPERRDNVVVGKDPAHKQYLASFIGAHMGHYISDVRLQLRQFSNTQGFLIRVRDKWHYEDVVYAHQVNGEPLDQNYRVDETVAEYNQTLSESVFSLCPSGAGPNTLRLWESLAVGSIPVLLGPSPRLPEGGTLQSIDWESIVIRITDSQIPDMPTILRGISLDEVRRRQRAGMDAYEKVREQRCF